MTRVFVSVGSNVDREHNIRGAVAELRTRFSSLVFSGVYESEPVGFTGERFYNLVAAFDTEESLGDLQDSLREIETKFGRKREQERFGPRTLDLDLLMFGDLVYHDEVLHIPRKEITQYAFVLKPLADIAPSLAHPETGINFQTLWKNFQGDKNSVWQVEFSVTENTTS